MTKNKHTRKNFGLEQATGWANSVLDAVHGTLQQDPRIL